MTFTVGGAAPSSGRGATGLHVVYRSYGGENTKGRPDFYSKLLALTSFARAVATARRPVEVIFVNDGPIPDDRLRVMRETGEVVLLPGVGNKRSLLTALSMPAARGWPARDVVWFAEDDYLYRADAIDRLIGAADAVSAADYLALYALIGDRPPEGGRAPFPPGDPPDPSDLLSDELDTFSRDRVYEAAAIAAAGQSSQKPS